METVKDLYEKLDANYDDACKRLMNENLVTRFVQKFPEDQTMEQLNEAVKNMDIESSFRAVHTLKSIAGVLSFTKLYDDAVNLTEQLRPRREYANPALLEILNTEYEKTISAIDEFSKNLKK